MNPQPLLDPIPGELPTGKNLRLVPGDETVAKLQELRSALDQADDPDGVGKAANWPAVVRECQEALTQKTKDLEIAARLVEGLVRIEGFVGLRDGLALVRELLDRYWDGLHPGCEDGEILPEIRARWINWLGSANEFIRSVSEIPIARVEGLPALSWFDYEEAQRVDEASVLADQTRYQELVAAGRIRTDDWRARLEATARDHLLRIFTEIQDCEREIKALGEASLKRFGEQEAPHLIRLDGLLSEIREHLERFVAPEAPADDEQGGRVGASVGANPAGVAAGRVASGAIQSRQDALARLGEVAEYFRRVEPHSPMAFLIQRAVRWGGMSFEQLMRDVVKTPDALEKMWETLGIEPKPES